jgi:hypothetical protein
MRQGRTLIHRSNAATVCVTPTLTPDVRGVQVAFRF